METTIAEYACMVLAGCFGFLLGLGVMFLFFLIGWVKIYTIGGDTFRSYYEGRANEAELRKLKL